MFIEKLSAAPDPIITATPIYAVDADKHSVTGIDELYMRPAVKHHNYTNADWKNAVQRTCTVVIDGMLEDEVPRDVSRRWQNTYHLYFRSAWGDILLTHQPGCNEPML
jgi:hypothetical protein